MLKAGAGGKRELEYLVEGCDAKHRKKLPKDLANFLLGNCVDLTGFKFPQGLYLWRANLRGANLREADLSAANLSEANLSEANLWRANLSEANLHQANLHEANLNAANLNAANLLGANLSEADLSVANLHGTDLNAANLRGANLSYAALSYANLRDTNFTNIKNLTPQQIKSACNWQEAKFDEDFQKELDSSPDLETPPDCSY